MSKRAVQQTTRTVPDPAESQQELQRTLAEQDNEESAIAQNPTRGWRIVPVRQSRIQDRPAKVGEKDSSLKIKIELDLEVEVELYARVKGDITIGLMWIWSDGIVFRLQVWGNVSWFLSIGGDLCACQGWRDDRTFVRLSR
jgi:hypothetical protein